MVESRAQPVSRTGVATPRFAEADLYKLAELYGTPYYLIDEAALKKKVGEVEQGFSEFRGVFRVAYSVKANFNPSVIKAFASEGIMFDLTAPAELEFIKRCGGTAESVIYTSITETLSEYESILKSGVRKVVVASYNGVTNLAEAASRTGTTVKTMIRVNPEVHVHAELRGSMGHGKFGLQFNGASQDTAMNVLRKVIETPGLKFEGFHFHLGSQIEDPSCYAEAIEKLEAFILESRKSLGHYDVSTIDIGGGLPASYGKKVPSPKELGSKVAALLNSLVESIGNKFTLIAESGRYLTAESAVLVSRIVNIKEFGERKYVYIDAGYHILLDAALLKHEYPVEVVSGGRHNGGRVVLVGRLCDPLDVFPTSSRSKLGGAEIGKLVMFREVGAYSIVMNMPFHSQPRPPVLMRSTSGAYFVARKAQTLEALFNEEGGDSIGN